jgi:hypothetical protein
MKLIPMKIGIINNREIYQKADEFGLGDLLRQTAKEIRLAADTQPGQVKSAIQRSVKGKTAFMVSMIARAGLFAESAWLWDWSTDEFLSPPIPSTSSTIDEIPQHVAETMLNIITEYPWIFEQDGWSIH